MFSFLKKKDKGPKITDLVFASSTGKLHALAEAAKHNTNTVFIAWFEESLEQLQKHFQQQQIQTEVLSYRQIHAGNVQGNTIIFIEHYPLQAKETEIFSLLANKNITVYSSLDEPLFKHFGGENIAGLLSKLGMNENEAISHSMITSSIKNVQEKLATKMLTEHSANSMEDWFRKNVSS